MSEELRENVRRTKKAKVRMSKKTCGGCRYYHPIFEHEGVCTATSDLHKTCDFTSDCAIGGIYPKPPPTNGDKIRQMDTAGLIDVIECPYPGKVCIHRSMHGYACKCCKRDWLNAPEKSEGEDE